METIPATAQKLSLLVQQIARGGISSSRGGDESDITRERLSHERRSRVRISGMAIELKDIEHLAGLARIAVSDNEKKTLQHDLEDILAYVSQISNEGYDIGMPEVGEPRNVMRADDEPHESGMFTEDILAQAPVRDGNRVFVKKIL